MTGRRNAVGSWRWGAPDLEAAATLVRPHLPAALATWLEPAGTGDFCFAFRADGWIVRVSRHAEAAEATRREACVLGRVAGRLPLAVPLPEHHAPASCPPFTMHREVTGAVLTRAAWAGLPGAARARVAQQLADFLRCLHGLTEEARPCGVPELDGASMAGHLRRATHVELGPLLEADAASRLDHFLAARAADAGGERPLALLHADVAPGHLLYDEASGELTGVIDFGDLVLGPPARDFIYIYEDFGVERCREVVAAYVDTDASTFLEEVRAWYLLEALSWTLQRLEAGAHADVAHGIGAITRELSA